MGHITAYPSRIIVQAEPRSRHAHPATFNTDAEVATQGHVSRPSIHAAVESADGWKRQHLEGIQHEFEAGIQLLSDRLKRVSGAKGLRAGSSEDEHAYRFVRNDSSEIVQQDIQVCRIDSIVF